MNHAHVLLKGLLVQVKRRCLHKLGAHLAEHEALYSQDQLVWAQHTQHHQLLDRTQVLLPGLWQGLLSRASTVKNGLPWLLCNTQNEIKSTKHWRGLNCCAEAFLLMQSS